MTNRIITATNGAVARLQGQAALAYAAAMLDAEGCVCIHRQVKKGARRGYILRLSVSISQNHLQTLHDFQILTSIPGRVYRVGRTLRSNRDSYTLSFSVDATEQLLRLLRPFLLRKAHEADIALEFIEEGQVRRHFGPRGVPDDVWATRERLARKAARLK